MLEIDNKLMKSYKQLKHWFKTNFPTNLKITQMLVKIYDPPSTNHYFFMHRFAIFFLSPLIYDNYHILNAFIFKKYLSKISLTKMKFFNKLVWSSNCFPITLMLKWSHSHPLTYFYLLARLLMLMEKNITN
jgi:hypothetical protein